VGRHVGPPAHVATQPAGHTADACLPHDPCDTQLSVTHTAACPQRSRLDCTPRPASGAGAEAGAACADAQRRAAEEVGAMRATLQVLAAALASWQRADCATGMAPAESARACGTLQNRGLPVQGKRCTCAYHGVCLIVSWPACMCISLRTCPLPVPGIECRWECSGEASPGLRCCSRFCRFCRRVQRSCAQRRTADASAVVSLV